MDERLLGEKSPIKILKIGCSTCTSNAERCKEDLDYDFCLENNFMYWYPKHKEYFCKGCNMYATLGAYINSNVEDFPYTKCCRHAEPCWRNDLYYPDEKMYVKRLENWKVVRCDKDGKEIPWEDKKTDEKTC